MWSEASATQPVRPRLAAVGEAPCTGLSTALTSFSYRTRGEGVLEAALGSPPAPLPAP